MPGTDAHRSAVDAAWEAYGDPRRVRAVDDVSADVSTNHVYRLHLDDGATCIAKVSSYGSYFLFREDHDRLHACARLLAGGRFADMLADIWTLPDGRIFTWYDGAMWAVLYDDVARGERLPPVLNPAASANLGREIAAFHDACTDVAEHIPLTSKSIKSDAIHLLELLESPTAPATFELDAHDVSVLWRHTHQLLERLDDVRYDYWRKIPVLIDWNIGNFSVRTLDDGSFRLFSRWDYDWFRIEPRVLDFYFLSRVSSRTGDRSQFSYGAHTLTEPSFVTLLRAYHQVFPLEESEVRLLPEVYRFFLLNYVVKEGARFFRPDLCRRFRPETAHTYLPILETLDISPVLRILDTDVDKDADAVTSAG